MARIYRLIFRDLELGSVTFVDQDFPNLWGQFEAAELPEGPLAKHIRDFIRHSIEAYALMEAGDDTWHERLAIEEEHFMDLIETEDWYLIGESEAEPILVPNFCKEDELVWRWNPGLPATKLSK